MSGCLVLSSWTAVRMEVNEAKSNFKVVTLFLVSFVISFAAASAFSKSRHAKTISAPIQLQIPYFYGIIISQCLFNCFKKHFLPRRLSSRAVSFPIPVLLPVITTTLPSRRTLFVQRGPWKNRILLEIWNLRNLVGTLKFE